MTSAATKSHTTERSPWSAKTVWLAMVVMLIGGGLWLRERWQATPPTTATHLEAAQFAGSATAEAQTGAPRRLSAYAPTTFRLGASCLAGFFLGWTFRRFLKVTLLLSGAAMLLIALAKKLGWFDLDWVTVESHVRQSFAWLQGEAGAFKQFVTGYLPSAGAAGVGAFLGFRRR